MHETGAAAFGAIHARSRLWAVVGPLVALVAVWTAGPRLWDDAYITLRYARSLAEGKGFVFNPGEYVLGTTTPLFTLLLAGLHWLTGVGLERWAFVLAAAGHVLSVALLAQAACRVGLAAVGGLASVLYATSPLTLSPALGGMESPLFVAVSLGALMPSKGPSWPLGIGMASAVAGLLRPEGVLVAVAAGLLALRHGRAAVYRFLVVVVLASLPWVIFASWYFGSPIPQSMAAKWASVREHPSPWSAVEYFLYALLALPLWAGPPVHGLWGRQVFGLQIAANIPLGWTLEWRHVLALGAGGLVVMLVVVGWFRLLRRAPDTVGLLAFSFLYVLAYAIADPAMFAWYVLPPLPVATLGLFVGAWESLCTVVPGERWRRWLGVLAASFILLGSLYGVRVVSKPPALSREQAYRQAIELIGPPAQQEDTVIGALEIGAVGYFSRARVVDYYGLVSPTFRGPRVATMIGRFRPDFFVFHEGLARWEGLLEDPVFQQSYSRVGIIDASVGYVRAQIEVWRRCDR
ncbi:MAG: hypothetical protein KatS3mg077_1472 [Candidatus Binatia bacterium]|nr:MAG: hypothetical protein KatS3mg077_1472 [Candidatus Binatia bacterium]